MEEYENIEIPEEILQEIAGGKMSLGAASTAKKMALNYKLRGLTKEECISSIAETYCHPSMRDDIVDIVEDIYAYAP